MAPIFTIEVDMGTSKTMILHTFCELIHSDSGTWQFIHSLEKELTAEEEHL